MADRFDGTVFVAVGGVPTDTHGANCKAFGIENQYSPWDRHKAPLRGHRDLRLKRRAIGGAIADLAGGDPHPQRAPGLSEGDVKAQRTAAVFALKGDELAACIKNDNCERKQVVQAPEAQRFMAEGESRIKR